MGDFLYNAPTDLALRLHNKYGAQSYLYVVNYDQGGHSFGPLQKDNPQGITRSSYGVTHMDDIFYLFPSEYDARELSPNDKPVQAALSRCVLQFVSRTPNVGPCRFIAYGPTDQNHLSINVNGQTQPMQRFKSPDEFNFWSGMITKMIEFTATPPPYFPYEELSGFQAATWSMLAFVLILMLLVVVLTVILFVKSQKEKRSLDIFKSRERELEERYNNEP